MFLCGWFEVGYQIKEAFIKTDIRIFFEQWSSEYESNRQFLTAEYSEDKIAAFCMETPNLTLIIDHIVPLNYDCWV